MASGNRNWRLDGPRVWIGESLRVSFQRTPFRREAEACAPQSSHGAAPLWPCDDGIADMLIAVGDDEAFWIGFSTKDDEPVAVRVLVDAPRRMDALTGAPPVSELLREPQNYLICPLQLALDGVRIDAYRAAPFTRGDADAGTGACLQLTVVALAAKTPLGPLPAPPSTAPVPMASATGSGQARSARQTVLVDPYGPEKWQTETGTAVRFRLVSHGEYARISGQPPPPPLDQVGTYDGRRLP